jgi:alpha-mannosidase
MRLRRCGSDADVAADVPAVAIVDPVRLSPEPGEHPGEAGQRWRLENGRLAVRIGPGGVEQIWDGDGQPCLAAPLAWRRWADRGEFWDAWDIAADHRAHPLPWSWDGAPRWLERGPLCARFEWRGRCGGSAVRLEGRLLAASPMLELTLGVDWRQRHELLQLEVPLARPALRWAADTPGGVLERPAEPATAREKARWEVPALSWLASVEAAPGGGLALLLDGPQGVSATPGHLGVSLLRAPTWPDPGADNGFQRQRLALMLCPRGWRADAVVAQAQRLREPLWCRPVTHGPVPARASGSADQARAVDPLPLLPPLADDLQLISLRADEGAAVEPGCRSVRLSVQNLGPCRRRFSLPPGWRLLARTDGLGQALAAGEVDPLALAPWQIGFWWIALPAQSS